jgi:nitrogen fixation/metabolism regulation signal transduction histidine kinase
MTFRTRLLALFIVVIAVAVGVVTVIVSTRTTQAFERLDNSRSEALVAQFRQQFEARRKEVARRIGGIASEPSTLQMAIDFSHPDPDYSRYVDTAQALAAAQGLDFLELVANDGSIISSAQWPARFGYKEDWLTDPAAGWNQQGAFLDRVQLPDSEALGILAVRVIEAGGNKLYIAGGGRLDQGFLASLVPPAGMRVLLHSQGSEPRIAGDETVHRIPLLGRRNNLLATLIIAGSRRELQELIRFIVRTGAIASAGGILLALVLAWWTTARVTRPVERLAEGAREVAAGNWNACVDVTSRDEIGELARAFNRMTHQLIEQRDRLLQAERVAAWRELARRLAHELKNPLFPLQITVENMKRAREQYPEQFDEVFQESTETLLTELANLKQIIGRFSDFAKMPPPELQKIDINRVAEQAMGLYRAQLAAPGHPPIQPRIELRPDLPLVVADPEQLGRALGNLVLNAIDAMPNGGTLTIRTGRHNGAVRVEVSDTGEGLTQEECERLFTPYYTTKKHGTGLGLAIVQSVVADHKGKIAVVSEPGKGATFRIDLDAAG